MFFSIQYLLFVVIWAGFSCEVWKVWAEKSDKLKRVHWLLVHYHKTGHDLASKFCKQYVQDCPGVARSHAVIQRTNIKPFIDDWARADLIVVPGAEMFFEWNEVLNSPRHLYRVLHFVRDPYDMIMSAYLYHSQLPVAEPWLGVEGFDICAPRSQKCIGDEEITDRRKDYLEPCLTFEDYTKEFSRGFGDSADVEAKLNKAWTLCQQLQAKYPTLSMSEKLRQARLDSHGDQFEAIRIEAMRSIINGNGGDLLRMAANANRENLSSNVSKRVFLSEFPIGNKTAFKMTWRSIFSFLMKDQPEEFEKPFWMCMTMKQTFQSIDRATFMSAPPPKVDEIITVSDVAASDRADSGDSNLVPAYTNGEHKEGGRGGGGGDVSVVESADSNHDVAMKRRQLTTPVLSPQQALVTPPLLPQRGRRDLRHSSGHDASASTLLTTSNSRPEPGLAPEVGRNNGGEGKEEQEEQENTEIKHSHSSGKHHSYNDVSGGKEERGPSLRTSSHVTSSWMDPVERQAYIQRLRDDPIIGPILDLVAEALGKPTCNE